MKKIIVIVAVALLALPAAALALVGECSNCHTMHNSFEGTEMAFDEDGNQQVVPNEILLRSNCVGCHAQGQNASISAASIPQVYHTDTNDLAGGNFAYIDNTKANNDGAANDRMGHNVTDVVDPEATVLMSSPPGFGMGSSETSHTAPEVKFPSAEFTCAGNNGCHGVRNSIDTNDALVTGLAAMAGSHHNNVNGSIAAGATSAGSSYRFLNGLYGNEDVDWQDTVSSTDHNDYFGSATNPLGDGACLECHVTSTTAAVDTNITTPGNTMSGFCSTCHGTFHNDSFTGRDAFVRHPTDYALPTTGEYAAYTTYDPSVPVARTSLTATNQSTVQGTAIVMCLSCHASHASPFESMLRWDYSLQITGNAGAAAGTGCFKCHSAKD